MTTIKYIRDIDDGNRTQTTDAATFVKRIKQSIPTYEFTGDADAICRLYLDFDYKLDDNDVSFGSDVDNAMKQKCISYLQGGCRNILGQEIYINQIATATGSMDAFTDCKTGKIISKYSWRLYVPHIKMPKNEIKAFVVKLNDAIKQHDYEVFTDILGREIRFFDESVYDPNKKIRCVGTSKYDSNTRIDENRPLRLIDGSYEDTVITGFLEKATLVHCEIPSTPMAVANVNRTGNVRLDIVDYIIREIRKIDVRFGNDYPEWSKIGWTFFNESDGSNDGLTRFDAISKQLDKYDGFDSVEKLYHSTNKNREKKLGIKWLMDVLKKNNADKSVFAQISAMQSNGKARFASDDEEASTMIYNDYKDIFKACNGRLFYMDENIWVNDMNRINDIMLQKILQSHIYSGFNDKTGKLIPYAQTVSKALKIRDALYAKIRVENNDPQLYDKFNSTTKGLLCFNDGVLNLKKNTFTLWKDVPKHTVFSTIKINYDYEQYFNNPNESKIQEIKNAIFEPLFGDKLDTALHFLARAMAGHNEDKRFGTYLGNRNCGKGVLFSILKSAFCQYVQTFELGNIMYCRKTAGMENVDTSKKMYWAFALEGARLAISQEVPDTKSGMMVNGKMLKKLSGGGDEIIARMNYDRQDTVLKLIATLFIMGNTSVEYDAEDCLEEAVEFCSVVQFKSQAEIDAMRAEERDELEMRRYRVSDPDIKQKCETSEDWKMAMVALILRNYKPDKVPIIREITTEENGLLNRIKEIFDFTYDYENHILPTKEVYSKLTDFSQKKIKTELNAMNIFDKKIKKNGEHKDKHCFVGIKYKPATTLPIAKVVNETPENEEVELLEC